MRRKSSAGSQLVYRKLPTLALLALLTAGCSRVTAPEQPTPQAITVHGTLQLTGPGQSGVQGRTEPRLAADDGTWFDLELAPEFAAVADPVNAGRGVTLTGELSRGEHIPVGGPDQVLRVTAYQLDAS
jgi:hypothetical protein